MKTKINSQLIFLIFFILTNYVLSSTELEMNNNLLDLNGELDKKLTQLFGFYKNLIKNTEGNDEVIMNTFKNKADDLIKENSNSNDNIYETDKRNKLSKRREKSNNSINSLNRIKEINETPLPNTNIESIEPTSFIQNSLQQENPNSENFSYQPFVWTEYTINKTGPSSRRGHSSVLVDTYLIIFGGCYMESKCFNDLFFLDLRTQNWIEVPATGTVPSARQGHSAVLYGSVMWIYGGSSSEGYLNDLYSFNLETREWKKHYFLSTKISGRAGHGAVVDNNARIIIFGGYTDIGYSNEIFVINLLEERFESPLSVGKAPSARESFAMIILNSRIYIFGGFQEGGVLNDIFSIDILTWTWTEVKTEGPTPPPRQGMAFTRVGKKIYVTGGCDFRKQVCFTDTFILDLDSLWWTQIENNKSNLTGRGDFSLTFFRGSLYTFGGCEMYKQCFNNVFIININDICPNNCANNGECKENIGCVCNQGFISHDCSERVKCKDDCSGSGLCHNNAKCGCYPGWTGIVCSTLIPCLRNCTNVDNGVCQLDSTCKCNPGFDGADCSGLTIIGSETDSTNPFKALTEINTERMQEIKNNTVNINTTNATLLKRQTPEANLTVIEEEEDDDDDADEEDEKKTEQQKLEENRIKTFKLAKTNQIYHMTEDCPNKCTDRGLCLNSTCFCEQGFSYSDCSMTYKEYLDLGVKISDVMKYSIASFAATFIITLIYLLITKTSKINGDHLEFEESRFH